MYGSYSHALWMNSAGFSTPSNTPHTLRFVYKLSTFACSDFIIIDIYYLFVLCNQKHNRDTCHLASDVVAQSSLASSLNLLNLVMVALAVTAAAVERV